MQNIPCAAPIKITTQRFELRSLKVADITPHWIAWLNDPDILAPLNAHPCNHTVQSLASQLTGYYNWEHYHIGIFDLETKMHIGIHEMNLNRHERLLQTNVLLGDKRWWGKDVVLETRGALLDYFFFEQNIEKAYGMPLARNFPMIFNYKAQGWTLDEIMPDNLVSISTGETLDQYRFIMLREDWAELRGLK
jgi:RimJ/RimL family protein N-acetyltransferase